MPGYWMYHHFVGACRQEAHQDRFFALVRYLPSELNPIDLLQRLENIQEFLTYQDIADLERHYDRYGHDGFDPFSPLHRVYFYADGKSHKTTLGRLLAVKAIEDKYGSKPL